MTAKYTYTGSESATWRVIHRD